MKVQTAHLETGLAREFERLVEAVCIDSELGRLLAGIRELSRVPAADLRIDAQPDRAAAHASPDAPDGAQRVEVEHQRLREDHIEIALAQVRAGVRDLARRPAGLEREQHLLRRAGIDADVTERADPRQVRRVPVRLERVMDPVRDTGTRKGRLQPADVHRHPLGVVHVERGTVLARDALSVVTREQQAAVAGRKARSRPPRAPLIAACGHRRSLAWLAPAL